MPPKCTGAPRTLIRSRTPPSACKRAPSAEAGGVLRRRGSGGSDRGQNSERKLSPRVRGEADRAAASDRAFARGGAAKRRGRNRAGSLANCLHSAAGRPHYSLVVLGSLLWNRRTPRTRDGGAERNAGRRAAGCVLETLYLGSRRALGDLQQCCLRRTAGDGHALLQFARRIRRSRCTTTTRAWERCWPSTRSMTRSARWGGGFW